MNRSTFTAMLVLLSACSSCNEARPGSEESPEDPRATTATPEGFVVLRGVVRLAEGAEVPLFPEATMQGGAGLQGGAALPGECPPPRSRDRMPVRMDASRGLSNVVLTVSDRELRYEEFMELLGPHEPVERPVVIRDCRLDPPVVAATVGDTLVMSSEHEYPFLPTFGRSGFMQALLPAEPRRVELEQGGVQAIRCGFTAPCGRTDVVIAYTPIHTLSGEDGRFELPPVPADRPLVIHAWHPLFQEATVELTSGEGAEATLLLEPAPQPEPPEPPTDPDARPEDQPGLF